MFVKVCGITQETDIDKAVELGFTAIGVVLYTKSSRFVGIEKSIKLAKYAEGRIKRVAVGIEYNEVKEVENYFDYIQITEFIENKKLILSIENEPDVENPLYIFDKSKGKGMMDIIPFWVAKYRSRIILAGGLNPDNIYEISSKYKPFGVDVSSGVELSPGIKSHELMKNFITEYRRSLT